jgi:Pyruvate/2-oxoacid:ferredoxin oxidoreductase delta subunit
MEDKSMKIDQDKCAGCMSCIPYCPLAAIKKNDTGAFPTAVINQDECVECGVCLRSGSCKVGAIWMPELEWPRAVRQAFSGVLVGYNAFAKAGVAGYNRQGAGGGRGTAEMKTNDITGRFKDGEVGIAKVTMAMAKLNVEFEPDNPLTALIDTETGRFMQRDIMKERCMSAIVELKVAQERAVEILEGLKEVAKEIDTVFSVDIINKCKDGKIPVLPTLEAAGIKVRFNGKTNIGLGRPLA